MMKISKKGQILPLVLVMILISVLLAVTIADIGFVVIEKIRTQAAADAGALAGATFIAREKNSSIILKFSAIGIPVAMLLNKVGGPKIRGEGEPFGIPDYILFEHLFNFVPLLAEWAIGIARPLQVSRASQTAKKIAGTTRLFRKAYNFWRRARATWSKMLRAFRLAKYANVFGSSIFLREYYEKALEYTILNYPVPEDITIKIEPQRFFADSMISFPVKTYKFMPKRKSFLIWDRDCDGDNPEYLLLKEYPEYFPMFIVKTQEKTCKKCIKDIDLDGQCDEWREWDITKRQYMVIPQPAPFGNYGWGNDAKISRGPQPWALHKLLVTFNGALTSTLLDTITVMKPPLDPFYYANLIAYNYITWKKLNRILDFVFNVMPEYYKNDRFIGKTRFYLAGSQFLETYEPPSEVYVKVTGAKIPLIYHFLPRDKRHITSEAIAQAYKPANVTAPIPYSLMANLVGGFYGIRLLGKGESLYF